MGLFTRVFVVIVALTLIYKMLRSSGKKRTRSSFTSPDFGKKREEVNKGELVKDALTGTYLAESEAIKYKINGEECYFASEENYQKFLKK